VPKYSIIYDKDLCLGCEACEIACKQEHNLPVGPRWIHVVPRGPEEVDGKLILTFKNIRCMHCGKPPCIDACPEGAISKRADGIVLIDPELCTGCKACIEACPFGAPQFNPENNLVEMCTLCVHRVEKGLKPACVSACVGGALKFGDINELTEELAKKRAKAVVPW